MNIHTSVRCFRLETINNKLKDDHKAEWGTNFIDVFQDKPWVFGHLIQLERRLGKDSFPLIDQCFDSDHRELVSGISVLFRMHLAWAAFFTHKHCPLAERKQKPCKKPKQPISQRRFE